MENVYKPVPPQERTESATVRERPGEWRVVAVVAVRRKRGWGRGGEGHVPGRKAKVVGRRRRSRICER